MIRSRLAGWTLAGGIASFLALLAALGGARAAAAPDEAAWKARVEKAIDGVEAAVGLLDEKKATPGEPFERVAALHARLLSLEVALDLPPGTVSKKTDLAALTNDVSALRTRADAVGAARKRRADPLAGGPKSDGAPPGPEPSPAPREPKDGAQGGDAPGPRPMTPAWRLRPRPRVRRSPPGASSGRLGSRSRRRRR